MGALVQSQNIQSTTWNTTDIDKIITMFCNCQLQKIILLRTAYNLQSLTFNTIKLLHLPVPGPGQ